MRCSAYQLRLGRSSYPFSLISLPGLARAKAATGCTGQVSLSSHNHRGGVKQQGQRCHIAAAEADHPKASSLWCGRAQPPSAATPAEAQHNRQGAVGHKAAADAAEADQLQQRAAVEPANRTSEAATATSGKDLDSPAHSWMTGLLHQPGQQRSTEESNGQPERVAVPGELGAQRKNGTCQGIGQAGQRPAPPAALTPPPGPDQGEATAARARPPPALRSQGPRSLPSQHPEEPARRHHLPKSQSASLPRMWACQRCQPIPVPGPASSVKAAGPVVQLFHSCPQASANPPATAAGTSKQGFEQQHGAGHQAGDCSPECAASAAVEAAAGPAKAEPWLSDACHPAWPDVHAGPPATASAGSRWWRGVLGDPLVAAPIAAKPQAALPGMTARPVPDGSSIPRGADRTALFADAEGDQTVQTWRLVEVRGWSQRVGSNGLPRALGAVRRPPGPRWLSKSRRRIPEADQGQQRRQPSPALPMRSRGCSGAEPERMECPSSRQKTEYGPGVQGAAAWRGECFLPEWSWFRRCRHSQSFRRRCP